jgi:hypothetical protein
MSNEDFMNEGFVMEAPPFELARFVWEQTAPEQFKELKVGSVYELVLRASSFMAIVDAIREKLDEVSRPLREQTGDPSLFSFFMEEQRTPSEATALGLYLMKRMKWEHPIFPQISQVISGKTESLSEAEVKLAIMILCIISCARAEALSLIDTLGALEQAKNLPEAASVFMRTSFKVRFAVRDLFERLSAAARTVEVIMRAP